MKNDYDYAYGDFLKGITAPVMQKIDSLLIHEIPAYSREKFTRKDIELSAIIAVLLQIYKKL